MIKYYGNIPGPVIWCIHILVGLMLAYIGYLLINDKPLPKPLKVVLLVLGLLMIVYHSYLWGFGYKKK